ncbi:hypothetical protein RB195_005925 [Necator americanus]|uniref:Uncharacterized protein n=1 Tax=Necator americanus TaxID=51031 RepID=A0ABR1BU12_NECAM
MPMTDFARCRAASYVRMEGKETAWYRDGKCTAITCQLWGAEYIGGTGRALCTWVKDHLDGLIKSRSSTPLGAHHRRGHENTHFNIAVTFLAREFDVLERKVLEAFYMAAKSLAMNRKEECIAVTNEMTSY